jgi:hypothetical protein
MIVVIPTNRTIQLEHLEPLIDSGARFIIVDDSEGSIQIDHPRFEVVTWQDRRHMLDRHEISIPKRNGACRDFGFYIAWNNSDDDEIIVALDDDCRIHNPHFAAHVEQALSRDHRPKANCEDTHLNVLDLYEGIPAGLYPRGFPYSARKRYRECAYSAAIENTPSFSLGLCKGIFDINAIDKLNGPVYDHPDAVLKHASVVIPAGNLISVCSMNMQFRRSLIPAVYQLPMHIEVLPGWVVDRYADIWGGFILKLLMDLRGDIMVAGEPMITHMKEGDYRRNIWQEHLGHLLNDEFLALLARAAESIRPEAYLGMMAQLNDHFKRAVPQSSPLLQAYLDVLIPALDAWIAILSQSNS